MPAHSGRSGRFAGSDPGRAWLNPSGRLADPSSMVRALPVMGLLMLLAVPAMADDPASELLGHWRSNRELTAREMDKSSRVTPEKRAILEPMFGELVFTYTATESTAYLEGMAFITPYELVDRSSDSVTIEFYDESEGDVVRREIFVRGDRMWVPVPNLGFHEIFTRIDEEQLAAALEEQGIDDPPSALRADESH